MSDTRVDQVDAARRTTGALVAIAAAVSVATLFAFGSATDRWLPMVLALVAWALLLVVAAMRRYAEPGHLVLSAVTLALMAVGTGFAIASGATAL